MLKQKYFAVKYFLTTKISWNQNSKTASTYRIKYFFAFPLQKMLNENKPELSSKGKTRTTRSPMKNRNKLRKMTIFHTIRKIYRWVGMESQFLIGCTNYMVWISHTIVKFVAISRIKVLKHFNDILLNGGTRMVSTEHKDFF